MEAKDLMYWLIVRDADDVVVGNVPMSDPESERGNYEAAGVSVLPAGNVGYDMELPADLYEMPPSCAPRYTFDSSTKEYTLIS